MNERTGTGIGPLPEREDREELTVDTEIPEERVVLEEGEKTDYDYALIERVTSG